MSINEKLLAIELILRDIRSTWRIEDKLIERTSKAYKLSNEIINDKECTDYLKYDMYIMINCINEFIDDIEIGCDGRYFREEFPYGYEEMGKIHGLDYIYNDKSEEFKNIIDSLLIYPKYNLKDL